jgi:cyclic pyranopterin phosphate synthase
VARIAGIQGAKKTPDLIPLCHPLFISGVDVFTDVTDEGVEITATVKTTERTGVEMEALTAVAVAGLAVIDMIKAIDRAAVISDVRVLSKSGGRRGDWSREAIDDRECVVITVSTRAAAGVYEDKSGPIIATALHDLGFDVLGPWSCPMESRRCRAPRGGDGRTRGRDHYRWHWTESS